jgi:hypothetical protein
MSAAASHLARRAAQHLALLHSSAALAHRAELLEAVAACTVGLSVHWLLFGCGAAAAAHKVESRVRHLAGLQLCRSLGGEHFNGAAAGQASCRGLVCGCSLRPNDCYLITIKV